MPSPETDTAGIDDIVERIAIDMHYADGDPCTVKWAKQPGKYRASLRKDVRDVLASMTRLGISSPATAVTGCVQSGGEVDEKMISAICAAVILGEDEDCKPVHLEPREARQVLEAANIRWLPIDQADRSIATVQSFPDVSVTLRNSYPVWVRDEDGRVYEAVWSEGHANYWWDLEGESPVDPVEFMPHPLDPRFAAAASEGCADV